MKTKNLIIGLGILCLNAVAYAQGLQGIVVEKYYQANSADVTNANDVNGAVTPLTTGSVTYRIYVDMASGYKFNSLFGSSTHNLKVNSTAGFYNDPTYGVSINPGTISSTNIRKHTAMLDSYFTTGGAGGGKVGVLKSEDTDGSIGNAQGILANNPGGCFGLPITGTGAQDGMRPLASSPATYLVPNLLGIASAIDVLDQTNGNAILLTNHAIAALGGVVGPTSTNMVLVAQFTTSGDLTFELNLQLQNTTTGVAENYVSSNPTGNELTHASLTRGLNLAPAVLCYQTATFNNQTCTYDITGTQPVQPTTACYQTATFNSSNCTWALTGTQAPAPTGLSCWQTATFNSSTCAWDVSGTQPVQPTTACYQTATFTNCAWVLSGTQPVQPTTACYQTATFNSSNCTWSLTGTQTSNTTTQSANNSYTWSNNGQTYTASGTYTGNEVNCVAQVLNLTITQTIFTAPSTLVGPYVLPVAAGVTTTSMLTVPETVGGYKMVGIPDGLGAFDNNNGTFTLLMNHELASTAGSVRAHGAKGAFVSKWIVNKNNLSIVSGSDLITSVYGWNSTTQSLNTTPSILAFNRFCSADLPAVSAFYNSATGLGTQDRILMTGEEGGSTGYQAAVVASGADAGKAYILGKFNISTNGSGLTGIGAWENALANPFQQNKTVVIGTNDGGTGIMNNSVCLYQGTKTNSGTAVDKAGLTNGTLKFINVEGNPFEITNATNPTVNGYSTSTTRATNITSGTAFTLSATASTSFARPEDGAWDPSDARKFYFVTTDRLDQVGDGIGTQVGRSRLWRLNFTDITNPDLGGTIDMLLDGTEGQVMMDNIGFDNFGNLLLLEDVGGAPRNGKIWQYTVATDQIKMLAKHDAAKFGDIVNGVAQAATLPFTNDEETSGIIDMSDILGAGNFLVVDQAHYTTGIDAEAVEGGQLLKLYNPDTYAAAQCATTSSVTQAACNSYVWNGITYANSGSYTQTSTNQAGCFHTTTLNLTITPNSTNTTTASAVATYTWANNGQTYTTSGVYTGTTANCVTQVLNLTILPEYKVLSASTICNETLYQVPVATSSPYSVDDVKGYDVVINYDATKLVPTGNVTITNELINSTYVESSSSIASPGVLNLTINLNGSAPASAEFNGTGTIFKVDFTKLAGFNVIDSSIVSVPFMQESYITGVQAKSVKSAKMYSTAIQSYTGNLVFWSDSSPITYNSASPSSALITNIYGSTGSPVTPNQNGQFTSNLSSGLDLSIQRDVINTNSVQAIVNAADAVLGKTLLINGAFTPSVYQIIALDVNLDGVVSAGDISQMKQRTTLSIPEYMQSWNYNNQGVSNGSPSKDWIFVDNARTATPAYVISSTFPANDNIGFSKARVPQVPFILPMVVSNYTSNNSTCPTVGTETYKGIMLGDVNGSYASYTADGLLKSEDALITIDLSQAVINGNKVTVPVVITSDEPVNALDLAFEFNESKLSFDNVSELAQNIEAESFFNQNDRTFRYSAYTLENFKLNQSVALISFESTDGTINKKDFHSLMGLLNGKPVDISFEKAGITSSILDRISIYPNPSNGNFTVVSSEDVNIEILEMSGKLLKEVSVKSNQEQAINLDNVSAGVYLIRVFNQNSSSTQRIVIAK